MEVGDKVKVVARKCGHGFRIGEVVTLCALETESGHRFEGDSGFRFWMAEEEYEVITPETGTLAELDVKPGDVVEFVEERSNTFDYFLPGIGDVYIVDKYGHACGMLPEYDDSIWRIVCRASDLIKLDYAPINVEKPIYETEADTRPLEHFQSGPVITETIKRIVPGVYGRISIHKNTDNDGKVLIRLADGAGEVNLKNCGHYMSRAELIAARDILSQLIDAMPSE